MQHRVGTILVMAALCLAPTASWADLAPYSEDFEALDQANPDALGAAGWLVFANVFNPDWSYAYGYGVFPAPNGTPGFSSVATGEGGPAQGAQQLVVYSDYNNGDAHPNGKFVEANVFQEQTVGAADVGQNWLFEFDAKRGDIGGATTAAAFIKTLDPANGYALTNFITLDTTSLPTTWGSYFIPLEIDPSLEGQIVQIGFLSVATFYEPSGVLYDNISFAVATGACCKAVNSPARYCVDGETQEQCEGARGLYAGDRTECGPTPAYCEALVVTMESMSAKRTSQGVQVSWTTATELDTVGFRIFREAPDASKRLELAAPMIPAMGDELLGGSYQFLDTAKPAGRAVHYFIEDVDIFGKVTRHGPIVVEGGQRHKPEARRDAARK